MTVFLKKYVMFLSKKPGRVLTYSQGKKKKKAFPTLNVHKE